MSNINWSTMQTAEEKAASALAASRAGAVLSKREFCLALAASGIISDAGCVAAAKGEWPDELAGFLLMLTPEQKRDVEIEWAASTAVERSNTSILVMGSWLGLEDGAVDALFGIAPVAVPMTAKRSAKALVK